MALNVVNRVFKDDQNRTLPFLLANSLDYIRATYTVEPYFGFSLSASQFVILEGNNLTLTMNSWEDYGFVAGETLNISNLGGYGGSASLTIDYIDGAVLVYSGVLSAGADSYNIGEFYVSKNPEGFNFEFNLIKNSDSSGAQSLIDSEVQRFTVDGVDLLAVSGTLNMTQLGFKSGMGAMSATLTRIADVSSRRRFEITVSFYVSPWHDGTVFQAGECVKPWAKIQALPQYNNPSVKLETINSNLGNTGFKDENWNGGVVNYTPTSCVWKDDLGNTIDALDYTQPSVFLIRIDGAFASGSEIQFKLFFPSILDDDFKNLPTNYNQNTISTLGTASIGIATPTTYSSAVHSSGAAYDVENINVANFTTYAIITGRVVPNAAFTTLFEAREEDNRLYRLWIRCENSTLDYNSSDSVNVEVNYLQAVATPIPLGEYPLKADLMLNHFMTDYFLDADTKTITEDDILKVWRFTLPKDERYLSIKGSIIAYNSSTQESFVLDSHSVSLDQYPILSDGTMPINYLSPRGYKLPPTSEMLNVEINRAPSLDGPTVYGVEFLYPFLSRWEYWLTQDNASNDFYGTKTKEWQHYAADPLWTIQAELNIETDQGEYSNLREFDIRTYDDWSGTSVIEFFKTDLTPLTAPLNDEIIIVRATHSPLGMVGGAINVWGNITVEPKEGSPRRFISSWLPVSDSTNPLQPIPTFTEIKTTINLTNIVFECYFDPTKMNVLGDIKFTSRVNGAIRYKGDEFDFTYTDSDGNTGVITANNEQEILTLSN